MTEIGIVTDADQGLGPALSRDLCRRLAKAIVYVTARDRAAADRMERELRAAGLAARSEPLDLRDPDEAAALAAVLAVRHGGLDVIVAHSAATVAPDVRYRDQVRAFVEASNHGIHRMITSFGPLLNDGGRFVVVSGRSGDPRHLPHRLRMRFDTEHMSLDELTKAMDDYVESVEAGKAVAEGWPAWIAVPSRVGQVAAMRVMARDLADEADRRDILINAACCDVDDTNAPGGTADVVWLATLPPGSAEPYGELIKDRRPV